ncbi:alpha/beta-hydrolase [Rhizodiscina lignyota]|uniref:Alpha/beta-hydrolase n=1 Tax=Rhizodiscina lignyota TaxID=1504668 RepID=A0A9P4ILI5_9PEZI|nr:alpha/beta-hydrolase [Rhizodiscina lignyota]
MASTADSDGEVSSVRDRGQQNALASKRQDSQAQRANQRFPLGWKDGLNQWWACLSPTTTEHRVLSFIPYLQQPPTHTETGSAPSSTSPSAVNLTDGTGNPMVNLGQPATPVTTSSVTDPYGPRRWHSNLVPLSGRNRALNEFSVERVDEEVENNLVMLHGYGAGLGFFYKNFEALSRAPGWKLYALDLLGMGRSTRPPFRIHAKDHNGKITEAENWFIDALEEWRQAKKIEKFTLLGHSMGGYMAVAYALKYPGHLNKLILASPVGIPEDPYAVNADLPEPQESTMINEFTQDQDETTGSNAASSDGNNFLGKKAQHEAQAGATSQQEPPRRPYPKWLTTLWDANFSPFTFVRWTGPLGPRLVSGWTSRRFSHLPEEEAQALHDYSYSLFRQRGSGEYVLAYVLAPGAFARSPLIRRIQGVGRQYLRPHDGPTADSGPRDNGFPVVLMYGENDWMDVKGGYAAQEKILNLKKEILKSKSAEEKAKDEGDAKVIIVPDAGHHLYLDGWEYFNKKMLKEMDEVSKREKRKRSQQ